ncbi:COX15/CtaA family protein [Stutzerimonas tarimensis]
MRLALATLLLTLLVVLLGAFTRLVDAGLGCPDWPGCYGFLGVPMSEGKQNLALERFPDAPLEVAKGWFEMVHRYFAGALGLAILGLAVLALRRPQMPRRLPLLLLAVVITQAMFGMWTVTLKLWPQVVTLHLLGGMTTLALVFLLCLRLSGRFPAAPGIPRGLRRLGLAALILAVLQIALGGWVSSNYAAVACLDFPTCQGQWWPTADFANGFHLTQDVGPNYLGGLLYNDARTAIHLTHRLGALLLSLVLLALAFSLWRRGLRGLAGLLLMALAAQLAIGIAMVLLHMPLSLAVAHNGGAAALLLALVLVNYRLRPMQASGQPVRTPPLHAIRPEIQP